jgi:hypothetical protein
MFFDRRGIIQFARGDRTVPNPTTSAILRAGGLAPRATLYRHDLAHAANPAVGTNPHAFLTGVGGAGAAYAFAAQQQIATFFASDGSVMIDPDGPAPFSRRRRRWFRRTWPTSRSQSSGGSVS